MREPAGAQHDEEDSQFSSPKTEATPRFINAKRYQADRHYEVDKRSETAREEGERKERMHNRWLLFAAVCYLLFTAISVPIMGNYCYWKSWWGNTTECRTEQQPCNR